MMSEKSKKLRKTVAWVGLFVVFLYPFWCLRLNKLLGWDAGKLYTFGLELKDFITAWIALGGVVGVVANFFLSRRRMEEQQRQFNTQIDKQNRQIEIQEKQGRDARFAQGVEMLGGEHESTRIGGAYSLYFLARDFEEYREPVCEILCAHLRVIADSKKFGYEYHSGGVLRYESLKNYPQNEVTAIFHLLFQEGSPFMDKAKNLEGIFLYDIDLTIAPHNGYKRFALIWADFTGAELHRCYLQNIKIRDVKFNMATFDIVDFCGADLRDVDFDSACFMNSYNNFTDAKIADDVSFEGTYIRKDAKNKDKVRVYFTGASREVKLPVICG